MDPTLESPHLQSQRHQDQLPRLMDLCIGQTVLLIHGLESVRNGGLQSGKYSLFVKNIILGGEEAMY